MRFTLTVGKTLRALGLFVVVLLTSAADAAPTTRPASPQTGEFELTFSERSPLSELAVVTHRMGWSLESLKATHAPLSYDLASERFQVYVPSDYTGNEPYGLFVWINAAPDGRVRGDWHDVLDKHKLIAIGADNSGNNREVWSRMGLAIDAAHNMKKLYNLDPRRIYVSGGSGGGRTSSHVGVGFPDAFAGGYYMIGVNFYRIMRPDNNPNTHWPPGYMPPPKDVLKLAKQRSRHVLLTGDNDPNREQTQVYSRGFEQDGFKFVTYIQVPEMGHNLPDAQWFEKGIVALDEPLSSLREADFNSTPQIADAAPMPATRPSPAKAQLKPTSRPATSRPTTPLADDDSTRSLRLAKLYLTNKRYEQAAERLNAVIRLYPHTPAAKEADELLKQMPAQ